MRSFPDKRRGSTVLEFSLVGIPLIFILISTFEVARGMWFYHTLSYAVKEGTRYAVVHGANCSSAPNACAASVADVARRIRGAAVGLDPNRLMLTFQPASGAPVTCKLAECLADTGQWPPSGANNPGKDVQISGTYPFQSMICMFWPGAGSASAAGTFNLPATSRDRIQF